MRFFYCLLLIFFASSTDTALADSKALYPDKTFETNTIEGIYLGVECGDNCYATVKLPSEESFTFTCSEEEAENAFGKNPGNRVSVTYEVVQAWTMYPNEKERMYCLRSEVFKSGKILGAANSPTTMPSPQVLSDYELNGDWQVDIKKSIPLNPIMRMDPTGFETITYTFDLQRELFVMEVKELVVPTTVHRFKIMTRRGNLLACSIDGMEHIIELKDANTILFAKDYNSAPLILVRRQTEGSKK